MKIILFLSLFSTVVLGTQPRQHQETREQNEVTFITPPSTSIFKEKEVPKEHKGKGKEKVHDNSLESHVSPTTDLNTYLQRENNVRKEYLGKLVKHDESFIKSDPKFSKIYGNWNSARHPNYQMIGNNMYYQGKLQKSLHSKKN